MWENRLSWRKGWTDQTMRFEDGHDMTTEDLEAARERAGGEPRDAVLTADTPAPPPEEPRERADAETTTGDVGTEAETPWEQTGAEALDDRGRDEVSFLRWLGELVVLVGVAFLMAAAIKTWVVQPFYVPSGSMETTIEINDRVLVNKFIYRFRPVQPGDIVVFDNPQKGPELIKRVIAVEGQTVDIRGGIVYVDGVAREEPYIQPQNRDAYTLPRPLRLPKGTFWAMGDNRANSGDSRVFGPQSLDAIDGKAFFTYWPVDRVATL